MNRPIKLCVLAILVLISILWLFLRDMYQGVILLAFSLVAMAIFDSRDLERNFYLALRKLYLCLDIDSYYEIVKRIEKNALLKSSVKNITGFLLDIGYYHQGNRTGLEERFSKIVLPKKFDYWRHVYRGLLNKDHIQLSLLRKYIDSEPEVLKGIAYERLSMMVIYGNPNSKTSDIMSVRSTLTYNLLIAEATDCLGKVETDLRLKAYYQKTVVNLKKEFTL